MGAQNERIVWGIHAGKTGDADSLFKNQKLVALGWSKIGDLSDLPEDREAFKRRVQEAFPDFKPGAVPNTAGQLFRFIFEMKVGDLVLYPSKQDKRVHLGEVVGDYLYSPKPEASYPHHRKVKWLKDEPRTRFPQGALYEIGSAMSFFQVKNYADDFIAVLEGKSYSPQSEDDETAAFVADEIEQTTRDFILKQLARELKGHPFAEFCAHLLNAMGYRCRVSPEGPDGGIDILAHKDELGFEPPIIKVQVKSTESSVGDPVVSALYGKVDNGEFGLLITLGSYSHPARSFAQNKGNLRLIDGQELVDLFLAHYDQFDSKYKGLIPLKRVFIPEPLEEGED